ncbi:MAG: hypothetical protein Q8R90_02795 [Bacteroidales bacterium]|jgi:hypothetical protein|nr:hypothetical protein [Bacteroidales bacterium]
MKKLIFILVIVHFNINANVLFSQNLNKLPIKVRDSLLIEIADKALEKYGPEYNRGYLTPVVKYEGEFKGGIHKGESAYSITYPYDKSKELFERDFSAKVVVVNKTGKIITIDFGNGLSYLIEEIEMKNKQHKKMPFSTSKKQEVFKL